MKDRLELEKNIRETLKRYKSRNVTVEVQQKMRIACGLIPSETQKFLNGKKELSELNDKYLYLFTKALYDATNKEESINPDKYFSPEEKEKAGSARQYVHEENTVKFPYMVNDAMMLGRREYVIKMKMSELVNMYKSDLIDYDFKSQRNAKIVKIDGLLHETPDLNKESVKKITKLVSKSLYFPDPITLNLERGSAARIALAKAEKVKGEEREETIKEAKNKRELEFDEVDKRLRINESHFHIVDGFHRLSAFVSVMSNHPDLDFEIPVLLKNYTIEDAGKYFGQINTTNPVDKATIKELRQERRADEVTKDLMTKSYLVGKISRGSTVNKSADQLVSFATLADAIDRAFGKEIQDSVLDHDDVTDYLIEFFNKLVKSFINEFDKKIEKTSENSIINHDKMFAGYVELAKRMRDENISLRKLSKIINPKEFDIDNKLWEEKGILNNKKMTRNVEKKIEKYFAELPLEKYKEEVENLA